MGQGDIELGVIQITHLEITCKQKINIMDLTPIPHFREAI